MLAKTSYIQNMQGQNSVLKMYNENHVVVKPHPAKKEFPLTDTQTFQKQKIFENMEIIVTIHKISEKTYSIGTRRQNSAPHHVFWGIHGVSIISCRFSVVHSSLFCLLT